MPVNNKSNNKSTKTKETNNKNKKNTNKRNNIDRSTIASRLRKRKTVIYQKKHNCMTKCNIQKRSVVPMTQNKKKVKKFIIKKVNSYCNIKKSAKN